ncbi:hypothetical protein [Planomonospora algeriensis]
MTVPPEELRPALRPAADFPPPTRDEWRELALGVLRKSGVEASSPEEALASTTYDGVTVAPLYDAADLPGDPGLPGAAPYLRARARCAAAGTSGSGTRPPTPRRSSPTWRTASPPSGSPWRPRTCRGCWSGSTWS